MNQRDDNPILLFWDLFLRAPVWLGPFLVALLFSVLWWLIPSVFDKAPEFEAGGAKEGARFGVSILLAGLAKTSRWLAPWASLVLLGIWLVATMKRSIEKR